MVILFGTLENGVFHAITAQRNSTTSPIKNDIVSELIIRKWIRNWIRKRSKFCYLCFESIVLVVANLTGHFQHFSSNQRKKLVARKRSQRTPRSKQLVNFAELKRTSPVDKQGSNGDSRNSDNAPAPASPLAQLEGDQDEPRPSVASTTQEELQLKQQVAKRIQKEKAMILELEKIKKEAEQRIQDLNKRISAHKANVEILKGMLEI